MAWTFSDSVHGNGLYSGIESVDEAEIATWAFSIDGHPFVLVKLGSQGTLVYDASTNEWAAWALDGQVGLGFKDGEEFAEFYLMGSLTDGKIYTFNMYEIDDEDSTFEAIVTGGVITRRRRTMPCYSVYAAGNRTLIDGRSVSLNTSDDGGLTWSFHGTVELNGDDGEAGWRSLGLIRQPGRIFEISDNGAYASILGLNMEPGDD